ncbi:hypothetical protein [Bradyrhizobium sp. 2TAF24]|uniref:hypothetical protein n=1 Tax=Bradyrhizobium sp. 2TAF24 TaxID=3233011 RepID=UPI003F91DFB4
MLTRIDPQRHAALNALEASITSARAGFACLFSSSDEYERALIDERRAAGRYGRHAPPSSRWPVVLFVGLALMVAGLALLMV